jgi:hypothetical protein
MTEHWTRIVERLERQLADAPSGGRERALARFAEGGEIGRQTLRTYLAAKRTLLDLPLGLRRKAEKTIPATSLETAGRWMTHHKSGAIAALRAYAMGEHTVRSFAAAEAAARDPGSFSGARKTTRNYPAMVEARLHTLEPLRPPRHDMKWERLADAEPWSGGDPTGKADFLLRAAAVRGTIAVLAVRPSPRAYDVASWCTWALGTAAVHGQAVLVIPHDAPADEFMDFVKWLGDAASKLYLMRDPTPPGERPTQNRKPKKSR